MVDIYGLKPGLLINRQVNHNTTLGGVFSIITILATLVAIFFLGQDLIYRVNPKILVQPKKDFYLSPFLIGNENYQFSLLYQLKNSTIIYDKSILNLTFYQFEFRRSPSGVLTETFIPSPSHKCINKTDFPNDPDRWNFQHTNNAYCLESNKEIIIENSHDMANVTNPERHVRVRINRCKNGTEKNVTCRTKEEQDELLHESFLILKYKDSYIDPVNFLNPQVSFWTDLNMYMDPKLFKNNYIVLKKNVILTDSGFFLPSIESKVTYKFDKFVESTALSNDQDFMEIRLIIDTEVNYVYRSYIKLWDLAANAGGVFKLLQTLCAVISYPFNKINFYCFIEENLFKGLSKEEKKPQNVENNSLQHNVLYNLFRALFNLYQPKKY